MTQPKRLSAERLEQLREWHARDSKYSTVLELLSHIAVLEEDWKDEHNRAECFRKGCADLRKQLAGMSAQSENFRKLFETSAASLTEALAQSKAHEARLVDALQKIDEPMKYHHWEEDPYTRAGCFQFVAHEALKSDPEGVETLAAIREAMEAFDRVNWFEHIQGGYVVLDKEAGRMFKTIAKLKEVFGEPR